MNLRGKTLVAAMAVGQVGGLLPHVAVPATMPAHLIPLWGLTNGEAGLMASAYALGYMLAVPFLTTLTDRIDARRILILGSLLNGLGTIAFGLLADGMASAMVLWSLVGIGFAGAYMPGLKALTDRLDPGDSSRSVTLYTASFSFGVGLSFLACQLIADAVGWRWAFVLTGLAPFAMTFVAWSLKPVTPAPRTGPVLDLGPALRNRAALGYSFAYGFHCFELYGLRTWLVAFWGFVAARGDAPLGVVAVSALFTLLAMPASILGNELALRLGRHRAITLVMLLSAAVALAIGFSAGLSPWLTLAPDAGLRLHRAGRFRRAHLGHGRRSRSQVSRRQHGGALDRRLRIYGRRRLGGRRRARSGGRRRPAACLGARLCGDGGGGGAGAGVLVVVAVALKGLRKMACAGSARGARTSSALRPAGALSWRASPQ